MSRNYTIGAADATTGVAANPSAPNKGVVVAIPAEAEHLDVPKALIDFVNSMPRWGASLAVKPPLAAGTAAVGASLLAAKADHVHPTEIPAHSAATNGKVLAVDTTGALAWVTPAAPVTELKPPVASAAALPAAGNTDGDIRVTLDDGHMHIWNDNPAGWTNMGPAAASTVLTATVAGKAPAAAGAIGSDPAGAHADHVHPAELPTVVANDDDAILHVAAGKWAKGPKITKHTAAPTTANPGTDGDLWFVFVP